MDNQFEQYIRTLRKELCCPRELRSDLMKQAQQMVERCLEDFPDASAKTLEQQLGSPHELAVVLMEGADPLALAQYQRRKRLCKRIAIVILAIISLLAVVLSIYYIHVGFSAAVTKESILIIHEGGLMEKFSFF